MDDHDRAYQKARQERAAEFETAERVDCPAYPCWAAAGTPCVHRLVPGVPGVTRLRPHYMRYDAGQRDRALNDDAKRAPSAGG